MNCNNCNKPNPEGSKFCQQCGSQITTGNLLPSKNTFWLDFFKLGFIFLVIIIIVGIIGLFIYSNQNDIPASEFPPQSSVSNNNANEISASIVNIFCPSTIQNEKSSGGSGIIISEDGLILTNSHIVPQNEDELLVDESGCLVILPDPSTGQPLEAYWANPIVLPGISDIYDLAYMKIYDIYFDEETGVPQGTLPKIFPAYNDTTRCINENLKLGEPVTIYGYPAISGGYSLTITDGVVSSFPGDGLIVTSAKISHGNSGGLAVDQHGCMIGIPSLVSSDQTESLGVIYSMDLVHKFSEEVENYLNDLE